MQCAVCSVPCIVYLSTVCRGMLCAACAMCSVYTVFSVQSCAVCRVPCMHYAFIFMHDRCVLKIKGSRYTVHVQGCKCKF